ncbi:MAG: PKD domain-containing protein, partial [Chloroflexi bacterium]|nr:PKD domain-containing protein [Chloroflexota bacterium]
PVTLLVTFADPGADTHHYQVQWGDGETSQGNVQAGARQFSVAHTYQAEGDYTATIRVDDDDGGMDTETHGVQVIIPDPDPDPDPGETDFVVYLPGLRR